MLLKPAYPPRTLVWAILLPRHQKQRIGMSAYRPLLQCAQVETVVLGGQLAAEISLLLWKVCAPNCLSAANLAFDELVNTEKLGAKPMAEKKPAAKPAAKAAPKAAAAPAKAAPKGKKGK
jgi:hypothetical protein